MIIKFQFNNSKNVTFRRTEGKRWKYMPWWNWNVGKERHRITAEHYKRERALTKLRVKKINYKLSYNLHIFLISYSYTPYIIALYDTVSLLCSWEINIMFWTSLMPQVYTVEQTQSVLGNFHYRDKFKASKQKSLDFHFKNPLPSTPNFAAEHMITIIILVSIQQLLQSFLLTVLSDMTNRSKIKSDKQENNKFLYKSFNSGCGLGGGGMVAVKGNVVVRCM